MVTQRPDPDAVERVVEFLSTARRILFVTGAGISAESGLPTYRGIGGLYNQGPTAEGLPIEVALSGQMMRLNPALTWKYIAEIERACRGARPNRAHRVVAEMEEHFDDVWVLTQNVDGFHQQAGSRQVIAIHGDINTLDCTACRYGSEVADFSQLAIPPRCPDCTSVLRPRVVLFGEMLPSDRVGRLRAQLAQGFDVVFSVGTTSVFPYIAQPIVEAKMRGVPTVEINPGTTEVSDLVDVKMATGATAALDAIWQAFGENGGASETGRSS